ncbi:hypothetical protein [Thermogemmatispora tikiterensis]|uniref:Uncharacterized protein n=1 Tax=Thermogemmatispora tikiterensis TaxID=1825093 RepID=A0A328VDM5_9CHLR|nr:hypothetical protein [Thermogemmatispora tikiterensis]RAQ94911.1 hypothetical protein A4R35_05135 [Thermogemmatispora tikiterensis]
MTVSGDTFDRLLEAIYAQQRLLEELERENRELRQQLQDLREGRGIFVEILGVRYPLSVAGAVERQITAPAPAVAAQPEYIAGPPSSQPLSERPEERLGGQDQRGVTSAEERSGKIAQIRASIGPLEAQQMARPLPPAQAPALEGPRLSPSYLEEMLLDEFAAAATGPLGAFASSGTEPGSAGPQSAEHPPEQRLAHGEPAGPAPTALDEESKAALRRELMGSFLLD